jgi:hypothetical protein
MKMGSNSGEGRIGDTLPDFIFENAMRRWEDNRATFEMLQERLEKLTS